MAIIRFTDRPGFRNPWAEFERIRQSLDQLSHNYPNEDVQFGGATVFPPVNMYEEKEHLVIKAEIPGVKTEDLEISLEGETLTLKGTRKPQTVGDQTSFHRREIERGTFSRALAMPLKVDPDNVSAVLKNGVLTVTVGKASEVKPRRIQISSE